MNLPVTLRFALFAILLAGGNDTVASSGTWVAELPGVRVGVPRKVYRSPPAVPPHTGIADGGSVRRVAWRFELPAGRRVEAKLCEQQRCFALPAQSGRSAALRHSTASGPFHFEFELPKGEGSALDITQLRLIVDYVLPPQRPSYDKPIVGEPVNRRK